MIGDVLAIAGDASITFAGSASAGKRPPNCCANSAVSTPSSTNWTDQKPKTRDKLEKGREQILQNRKMVELDCHLPLPVPIDGPADQPGLPRLIESMEKYEFKSLLQEVRDEAARAGRAVQGELL